MKISSCETRLRQTGQAEFRKTKIRMTEVDHAKGCLNHVCATQVRLFQIDLLFICFVLEAAPLQDINDSLNMNR